MPHAAAPLNFNVGTTFTQTATNTSDNFTTPFLIEPGLFSVGVSGSFTATCFVQRSYAGTDASTFVDVTSYTTTTQVTGEEGARAFYRIGTKASGFTSGTLNMRIVQCNQLDA
jgi:hypothetical protein